MATCWDRGAALCPFSVYALTTLLFTGVVESQSSNNTELLFNLANQTAPTLDYGTNINVTLTDQDLLQTQMDSNETLITEDDEMFQDWENTLGPRQCHEKILRKISFEYCGEEFNVKMRERERGQVVQSARSYQIIP
ncbi:hypothetical protein WMY93_010737 [Mugilogobius chulae]|uniref:Uncharacterized protein n=1 Tax=Mugilogobius chulae TaxID=88201 RepID=A0AAW0PEI7_9GOBI